ncbi:DUF1328 family protein [Anaerobacillus alkaliphilus]|uniref:DUF1328 family protein n=1 Tax=Anaerobacillus alkaliphilus TaxID=1548597 RepID=UPI00267D6C75
MLRWSIIFFIIALIAAFFGFIGIAGAAVEIAKFIFYIFIIFFIISLIGSVIRRYKRKPSPKLIKYNEKTFATVCYNEAKVFLSRNNFTGSGEMIENKKYFYWAIAIAIFVIILNLPFPHARSLIETILLSLNASHRSAGGIHYVGVISLILVIISLFLLSNSLKKYRGRFVLLGFVVMMVGPVFLVSVYQQSVATGIYAVSYDRESSNCQFTMIDDETLVGTCKLPFVNHSRKPVEFSVEFYERHRFEGDPQMLTLMNHEGLHEITLSGRERRIVTLETEIDISTVENHIWSGTANGVNIIIKSEKSRREL